MEQRIVQWLKFADIGEHKPLQRPRGLDVEEDPSPTIIIICIIMIIMIIMIIPISLIINLKTIVIYIMITVMISLKITYCYI